MFAIARFRYIEVLFQIFYYYWRGKKIAGFYGRVRDIVVHYIEVRGSTVSLSPLDRESLVSLVL